LVVERKYDRSERLCLSYPSFMQFLFLLITIPFYFQRQVCGDLINIRVICEVMQLGGENGEGIKCITGNENFTKRNNWDPN
jgi:hypothetical protein